MFVHTDLQRVAALLERACQLALVLEDEISPPNETRRIVASELINVLDEARTKLFRAVARQGA